MKKATKTTIYNEKGHKLITIPTRDGLRMVSKPCYQLTDTAIAYLDSQLSKMAYKSLAVRFAKSGNFQQLKILWTAQNVNIRKNNADYHEMLNTIYEKLEISEVIEHETVKITAKWTEIDEKTGKAIEKKSTISVPCDVWSEIRLTDLGREYLINTIMEEKTSYKTTPTIEFDDILGEAWTACMELQNFGILVNFDSIWQLKWYVYRKINRYLDNYSNYSISIDDESIMAIDRKEEISSMDDDSGLILSEMEKLVKSQLSARVNASMAWKIFKLTTFGGYTQMELASIYQIGQKTVSRYVAKCKEIIAKEYKI